MNLNKIVLQLLSKIKDVPAVIGGVSISETKIVLNDSIDLQENITSVNTSHHKEIDLKKFSEFIDALSSNLVRLNHVGVGYWCVNIEEEFSRLGAALNENIHIYEEPSDEPYQKWFFTGNAREWEKPLFEIVLTESPKRFENDWIPHVQIDIDTSLTYEEIITLTNTYFGKDFFVWWIDVPNYGKCLGMGMLGIVNGTKIYLGVGTKLRGTEYHRTKMLKKLI